MTREEINNFLVANFFRKFTIKNKEYFECSKCGVVSRGKVHGKDCSVGRMFESIEETFKIMELYNNVKRIVDFADRVSITTLPYYYTTDYDLELLRKNNL